MSMSMPMSMDMDSMSSATSHTGSMEMASATSMSMPSSSSSMGMDMDMDMSMHMYFTTQYKDYPVLFRGFKASDAGQAFGIFVLLFFVAFLTRGLEFVKAYLEQHVWADKEDASYVREVQSSEPHQTEDGMYANADSTSSGSIRKLSIQDNTKLLGGKLPMTTRLTRNVIRLLLCFLPDLFGFALMLAAMSYTLVYFFAIVTGLGIGRFFFEKLGDHYKLVPSNSIRALHC